MSNILVNKIRTPDGTVLESRHRWDFKSHRDANGEEYFVDGGLDYLRGTCNKVKPEYLHVYTTDSHDTIREAFTWGTYGKDGNEPFRYIQLRDMTEDHINNILETQPIPIFMARVFLDELEYRKLDVTA